jgi:pimeloyl-ACP methyl ester carboxylesterase
MSPFLALISILFGGDKAQDAEVVPEPAPAAIVVSYQPEEEAIEETQEAHSPSQRWVGVVELPGQKIDFAVKIEQVADRFEGTLDIPMQGLSNGKLSDVSQDGNELRFTFQIESLPEVNWPTWVVTIDETGKAAAGELQQSGATFPTTLTLDESGEQELLNRPQNPKRPLSYREIEVTVDAGEHTLAGTLTLPNADEFGDGPYLAAVMITGSGPQDRDETLLGHKPFLVLSDHLAHQGIAALRCDDRGFGASTGDFATATTLDFADDARACVEFLSAHESVSKIGLMGHSEGGLISPFVAAGNDDVDFVVLLAGTSVPGREILVRQTRAMSEVAGMTPEQIDTQDVLQAAVHTLVVDGGEEDAIREQLRELVILQLSSSDMTYTDELVIQYVDQSYDQITSPWIKQFLTLDPRQKLAEMKQPTLALFGSLDIQVLSSQNLPEMERVFAEAGKKNYKVVEFDGLNHMFQHATTGAMSEYAEIENTIEEHVLTTISDWILENVR